ncbi:hypothetical protein TrST_g1978 [Triparma strigata]|uniref:Uncharacterized protein n=1 Tax=Triparma strigata TaxID=1606541 RepID=A0A9W7AVW3_9STRA|nr:hypothetical protein TrST_g1978 [Triparma strigata]
MEPVSHSPTFTALGMGQRKKAGLFSWLFPTPQEWSPDLVIFALNHPSFNIDQARPSSISVEVRLQHLNQVYSTYKVGDNVWLVEPEDERIVKMEMISVQRDTVTVGLAGFGLVHSGRTSTRTVPKSKIFGGFPCTTFVPSMPIRLLKKIIAGKDQGDLGLWPEKVSPGKISFELNGRVIQDEEVGIGTLSRWGARGKLEVRVGRERVPFVFE